MVPETPSTTVRPEPPFREELARCWREMPYKGLFFALFGCWFALFWFLGNPTLGYVDSPAILGWLNWIYEISADDRHGRLMPFVVLVLFWLRRKELLELPKRPWWPGVILLVLALGLHVLGYMIQQPQVCLVAFLAGIYALMGITWGWPWLKASFFPYFLMGFSVPVGSLIVAVTFPLRMAATNITAALCKSVLGINVIQDGTRIMDSLGQYQYEVAAACSGIRSLTATAAIAMIYGFMSFNKWWQRLLIIGSAVPLAVASNVFRLSSIIVAAEAFGQKAGNWIHNSTLMSLLPYVPAIGGMLLLGHLISRPWRIRRREVLNGRGLASPAARLEAGS